MLNLTPYQKILNRLEDIKKIHFTPRAEEVETFAEAMGVDEETLASITETAELIEKTSITVKDVIETYGNLFAEGFDPYVVAFMAFHSGVIYGARKMLEKLKD